MSLKIKYGLKIILLILVGLLLRSFLFYDLNYASTDTPTSSSSSSSFDGINNKNSISLTENDLLKDFVVINNLSKENKVLQQIPQTNIKKLHISIGYREQFPKSISIPKWILEKYSEVKEITFDFLIKSENIPKIKGFNGFLKLEKINFRANHPYDNFNFRLPVKDLQELKKIKVINFSGINFISLLASNIATGIQVNKNTNIRDVKNNKKDDEDKEDIDADSLLSGHYGPEFTFTSPVISPNIQKKEIKMNYIQNISNDFCTKFDDLICICSKEDSKCSVFEKDVVFSNPLFTLKVDSGVIEVEARKLSVQDTKNKQRYFEELFKSAKDFSIEPYYLTGKGGGHLNIDFTTFYNSPKSSVVFFHILERHPLFRILLRGCANIRYKGRGKDWPIYEVSPRKEMNDLFTKIFTQKMGDAEKDRIEIQKFYNNFHNKIYKPNTIAYSYDFSSNKMQSLRINNIADKGFKNTRLEMRNFGPQKDFQQWLTQISVIDDLIKYSKTPTALERESHLSVGHDDPDNQTKIIEMMMKKNYENFKGVKYDKASFDCQNELFVKNAKEEILDLANILSETTKESQQKSIDRLIQMLAPESQITMREAIEKNTIISFSDVKKQIVELFNIQKKGLIEQAKMMKLTDCF
ncbi:MAG: hypothetical protein HQK49_15685 [Oligoflexia bacterium]|nr:hypothetical protein [Oligoflexia bacterium]